MAEECPSCFLQTFSVLRPCGHFLCQQCADKWFARDLTCPTCRGDIIAIFPCSDVIGETRILQNTIYPYGITIADGDTVEGVRVENVYRRFGCRALPLHEGDTILRINGIYVDQVKNAKMLLSRAKEADNSIVTLDVIASSTSEYKLFKCFR